MRSAWLVVLLVVPLACDKKDAPLEPACDAPKVAPSKGACFTGGACNPVTGAPCVDQACDHWIRNGQDLGYQCVDLMDSGDVALEPVAICGACNAIGAPRELCGATLGCLTTGRCARYCCDDSDCGSGSCFSEGVLGGVGTCVD